MKPYKVLYIYNYYSSLRELQLCIILIYDDQTLANTRIPFLLKTLEIFNGGGVV
jgi:hypothetical protein